MVSKCEYCKVKDVDGIIMLGGITLKVCSPECMQKLIEKLKQQNKKKLEELK